MTTRKLNDIKLLSEQMLLVKCNLVKIIQNLLQASNRTCRSKM